MANLANEGNSREYDIFLSFRGEDTRNKFVSHLYEALDKAGYYTFIDYNLQRGEIVSEQLFKTIELSKISVVILSENYASSTWCLNELEHILKCKKDGQSVLPVFYEVEPSKVRKPEEGKFGDNLSKHEEKFKDKVQDWKAALTEVGNLSGCHYEGGLEAKFIQEIIEKISEFKIKGTLLFVTKYPVGVNSRAKEVESLIDIKSDDVRMVGIHGLGGIGKTTIAKAVYNKIVDNFERSCFLENVRENSRTDDDIIKLQEKILSKILPNQHLKVNNVSEGINVIKERLHSKRVLLVLDDVSESKQIENLLGNHDWLVSKSRVIITTRDEHLLTILGKVCTTKFYKVKKLDNHEALELFSQYAFHKVEPNEEYFELTNQALYYARSLPLALRIIGSNLCGKTKPEWEDTLRQYEKYPNGEIYQILKVSYDGLEENEKIIFLDISCFFKGRSKDFVEDILDKCNLYPKSGIPILVHKSLITSDCCKLSMHDLIQQMGMKIVREESPFLRKRSRLCNYEDALKVLRGNEGSEEIRGIMLHSPTPVQVQLHPEAFKKMENLIFLMVYNVEISEELTYFPSGLRLLEWPNYPFDFPSNFGPQELVDLKMPKSCITLEMMFKQGYLYENIKSIDLKQCQFIRKFPGFRAPNLEDLDLRDCGNLTEIHDNIGLLDKLKYWRLDYCKKLEILPSKLNLKSLEWLSLVGCKRLKKFPQIHPEMKCVKSLGVYMDGTCIRKFPSSVRYLTSGLYVLRLRGVVQNLDRSFLLSRSKISRFKSLLDLDLKHFNGNTADLNIWLKPDYFPVLQTLDLSNSNIVAIPESITKFTRLQYLLVRDCKQLQEIPRLPQSIRNLDARNCRSLDLQSLWRLLDQFGEFLGISPAVMGSYYEIIIPADKIPMWFKPNHRQSVGNSISFSVGPKIPNFGVFIALQSIKPYRFVTCHVEVLINREKGKEEVLDDAYYLIEDPGETCENLLFQGLSRGFDYMLDPSEVYHIEVVCEIVGYKEHHDDRPFNDSTDFIKWMGVHVECICCCPGSPITKQRRVSSPMDLADLGFPDGFDLGSSSMTQILDSTRGSSSVLDDTEQLPLPPVSPTSYCSDLDHGVSNSGGHSRRARIRLRRQIRIRLRRKSLAESRALLQPLPCGKTGLKMKPLLTLAIFVILIQSLLLLHFANNT